MPHSDESNATPASSTTHKKRASIVKGALAMVKRKRSPSTRSSSSASSSPSMNDGDDNDSDNNDSPSEASQPRCSKSVPRTEVAAVTSVDFDRIVFAPRALTDTTRAAGPSGRCHITAAAVNPCDRRFAAVAWSTEGPLTFPMVPCRSAGRALWRCVGECGEADDKGTRSPKVPLHGITVFDVMHIPELLPSAAATSSSKFKLPVSFQKMTSAQASLNEVTLDERLFHLSFTADGSMVIGSLPLIEALVVLRWKPSSSCNWIREETKLPAGVVPLATCIVEVGVLNGPPQQRLFVSTLHSGIGCYVLDGKSLISVWSLPPMTPPKCMGPIGRIVAFRIANGGVAPAVRTLPTWEEVCIAYTSHFDEQYTGVHVVSKRTFSLDRVGEVAPVSLASVGEGVLLGSFPGLMEHATVTCVPRTGSLRVDRSRFALPVPTATVTSIAELPETDCTYLRSHRTMLTMSSGEAAICCRVSRRVSGWRVLRSQSSVPDLIPNAGQASVVFCGAINRNSKLEFLLVHSDGTIVLSRNAGHSDGADEGGEGESVAR